MSDRTDLQCLRQYLNDRKKADRQGASQPVWPVRAERVFAYEDWRLLGEHDAAGVPVQETVWLGDLPIATVQGGQNYYIHTDHLGTPRVITETDTGKEVWRWESDPFGTTPAEEDPDGDGVRFAYPLRFPGQYFDAESGRHYNYFRTYDPSLGRYLESDPIGLEGGLNTYSYVGGNPLRYTDPEGLAFPAVVGWCAVNPVCRTAAVSASRSVVRAVVKACTDSDDKDDECDEIIRKINEVMKDLFRRYMHQCRNKRNLWESHVPAYEGKQTQLAKLVAEAEAKGCEVPPKAYEWLATPCPTPGTRTPSPGY